ncbi:hypothetical protein HKX48_002641 [Thoreauomyces humboldtii]|nr:hypothetical protein HKX48_002641 [Thoreauomyces humboldtii]
MKIGQIGHQRKHLVYNLSDTQAEHVNIVLHIMVPPKIPPPQRPSGRPPAIPDQECEGTHHYDHSTRLTHLHPLNTVHGAVRVRLQALTNDKLRLNSRNRLGAPLMKTVVRMDVSLLGHLKVQLLEKITAAWSKRPLGILAKIRNLQAFANGLLQAFENGLLLRQTSRLVLPIFDPHPHSIRAFEISPPQ